MPAPHPTLAAAALSFAAPLPIERAEITAFDGHFFARVQSGDFTGVAALNHWTPALVSLWQTVVFPFWLGRDARDLATDVEQIGRLNRNYQLASAPFWMAVAGIELALWDLLGQVSQQPVAALLSGHPRPKVPVYLSTPRRDLSAAAEIEYLSEAIEKTGAKAVKINIGGRFVGGHLAGGRLQWSEPTEARDGELLRLARENWGEKFVIYAAANGSFGADKAIEVGQILHQHKVAWFEEPCDWEDFEATRAVAGSVQLPVAGGGQDSSWPKWKWLLESCALDIAQPDVQANGGLARSWNVAQLAASLNVMTTPHLPHGGPEALPALHFAAALEKPAPFLQWDALQPASPSWLETLPVIVKGALKLPTGAGWGAVYDEEIWQRAEILAHLSV